MTGCRHNAKNTLDKNYLYLAERLGLEVQTETKVTAVRPLEKGYEVEAKQKEEMAKQEAMMKEFEAKEKPAMDKYIADNKIMAKPTTSGLIYIETKKGSGANPNVTDIVTVHNTGKLLDGTVFDSSVERGQPAEFALNQVIPGWTEGLQLMKKGGKAQLLIPSSIAYGPRGAGERIPPYSPLLFEVELIDFKAAPAQPEAHSEHDGHNHGAGGH